MHYGWLAYGREVTLLAAVVLVRCAVASVAWRHARGLSHEACLVHPPSNTVHHRIRLTIEYGSPKSRHILLVPSRCTFSTQSVRGGAKRLAALLLVCLLIVGCTTPVGVERVDPQALYRTVTRNVLSSGDFRRSTRIVLTRWDLTRQFATNPEAALAALQSVVASGIAGSDEIFTLRSCRFNMASGRGSAPLPRCVGLCVRLPVSRWRGHAAEPL